MHGHFGEPGSNILGRFGQVAVVCRFASGAEPSHLLAVGRPLFLLKVGRQAGYARDHAFAPAARGGLPAGRALACQAESPTVAHFSVLWRVFVTVRTVGLGEVVVSAVLALIQYVLAVRAVGQVAETVVSRIAV